MDERQRNEFAFTYERFRMAVEGQNNELVRLRELVFRLMDRQQQEQNERSTQPTIEVERLATVARAVREQLLRQVTDADLYRTVLLPRAETVAITQEIRQNDLALVMSHANVNIELAAIAYLESEGNVVDAIVSLDEGTERRARLVDGLRQRQAQLGLQVTTNVEEEAEMSEERREVLHEARRAFQRAANLVSTARDEQAARDAGANLPIPSSRVRAERMRMAQEMAGPLWSLEANGFVDGHTREWRNSTVLHVPLPNRMAAHSESHFMATNHGPLSLKRSPRMTRGRELVLKSLRASMEALEEQVEACTIDEGTYHEKAMELKSKFDAVSSGEDDDDTYTTRPRFFRSPNWYEAHDVAALRDRPVRPFEGD